MEIKEFSFKELYEVKLKSTYQLEVGGVTIEPGEVVACFDKIQISNFSEIKRFISARGGYLNEPQVSWDDTRELKIDFNQGIFSKSQFALLNNLKFLDPVDQDIELIGEREELETDGEGKIWLKQIPHCDVYIYDAEEGFKIRREEDSQNHHIKPYWKYNGENEIQIVGAKSIPAEYRNLIVDYCFAYEGDTSIMQVGKEFTNGYLWLEGKTRVQDDVTGQIKTGIIRIPKLKLMSQLSIQIGRNASPQVGRFSAVAYPTGSHNNKEIMRLIFLGDDIDADM